MDRRPTDAEAHQTLLAQLRQSQSELAHFPSSSYPQLAVLALGVTLVLGFGAGVIPVFVPPYLVLPFALIPGWRVFSSERDRRARLRAVTRQIQIVEERLRNR